jgi:acyl-CoA thioesterase
VTSAFDRDTAVRREDGGSWSGAITDDWSIAGVPNGGYVHAIALRTAVAESPHPHPLTSTAHFLGKTSPGAVEVRTEVVKTGRTYSTVQASIHQEGRERVRTLTTLTDLGLHQGPTAMDGAPPDLGRLSDLHDSPVDRSIVRVADRFEYRMREEAVRGTVGEPSGTARIEGLIRFADGREPDPVAMPLIVDAFPPTVFQLGHRGWTPTIELTVHLRAVPAPGWLLCVLRTRYLQNGILEEDAEVWDASGRLVALSRQLATAAESPW